MSVQERLMKFINYKKLSKLRFAKSINRSSAYVTNIVNSVGKSTLKIITVQYPELNIEWLLTGEGEMIISANEQEQTNTIPAESIPVVPLSAQAGKLTDFTEGVMMYDCERMLCPIKGADFAVPVSGDSMSPEYPSGSKVIVRKIDDQAFIDWGRTYVLDTCNGVVIKNIYPSESENAVRCVSINPNFPSFDINKSDIYSWYRVLMSLSLK